MNIYVFFIALVIISVFWSEIIIKSVFQKKLFWKITILFLVIILSIPNTVRFLWNKVHFPETRVFPKTFIQAAEWFNKNKEFGSTILQPIKVRYLCYFADRRVVLDDSAHSYLTYHLTTAQIRERKRDIDRFLQNPVFSADVLSKYNVSYVFVMNSTGFLGDIEHHSTQIVCFSDLETKKILKYQKSHRLEIIFKNKDYLIFKVQEFPEEEREIFVLNEINGKRVLEKFNPLSNEKAKRLP